MSGLEESVWISLSASEKVAISHILIGVALADGKIDPAEIRQLEKLYTPLGLDKGMVASDIHNLSSSRFPRPDPSSKFSSATPTQGEAHPTTSFCPGSRSFASARRGNEGGEIRSLSRFLRMKIPLKNLKLSHTLALYRPTGQFQAWIHNINNCTTSSSPKRNGPLRRWKNSAMPCN